MYANLDIQTFQIKYSLKNKFYFIHKSY